MRRRPGLIWIAAGAVFALLAGVLAFYFMLRMSRVAQPEEKEPEVEVVFATSFIEVRDVIRSTDVETKSAPARLVPENAILDEAEVVGQLAVVPISPDQMILSSHVVSPTIRGANFAFTMDEDNVAMAYPAGDLMSRSNLLKPGDHVDLLFSIEVAVEGAGGGLVTFDALQNLEIAWLVRPTAAQETGPVEVGPEQEAPTRAAPSAIVFALDPQDALILKHLKDIGGVIDIVLRAPGAEERFDTRPVHMNYLIDRYQLRVPILP